LTSFLGEI